MSLPTALEIIQGGVTPLQKAKMRLLQSFVLNGSIGKERLEKPRKNIGVYEGKALTKFNSEIKRHCKELHKKIDELLLDAFLRSGTMSPLPPDIEEKRQKLIANFERTKKRLIANLKRARRERTKDKRK